MKNKEITAEKFSEFLAWLSPDAELAGIEYERLWFRLTNYFGHRKCCFADELADETINRVILKIGAETIENKMAFIYGFAKNIYLESLRKEKNHLNIDELKIPVKNPETENDFSGECLEKCLNELSPENKEVLLEYFSEDKYSRRTSLFSGESSFRHFSRHSPENKEVLLEYFSEDKQKKIDLRRQLAEKLQLTQTALRMMIVRQKQKLKICLQECMAM